MTAPVTFLSYFAILIILALLVILRENPPADGLLPNQGIVAIGGLSSAHPETAHFWTVTIWIKGKIIRLAHPFVEV